MPGAVDGRMMIVTRTARWASIVTLLVLSAILPTAAQAPSAAGDRWAPVRFLLGAWEGASEGRPGTGTVKRQYQLVLKDQFIEVRNTSTYPPQAANPKGEVHDDHGFISYDRSRKRFVLRQFHVEGFVNQYVQDQPAAGGVLSFTSESIENIPAGWRARETYVVHGPDAIEEIFELAEAGKPFEVYSRTKLTRVK
jgi:hypothetical protein